MSTLPASVGQTRVRISFWRFVALGAAIGTAAGLVRFTVILTSSGLPSGVGELVEAIAWLLWSAAFFTFPLAVVGLISGIATGMMSPIFSVIRRRALGVAVYAMANVLWFSGVYVASLWVLTGSVPLAAHAFDFIVVVLTAAIASAVFSPWALFRQL